MTSPTWDQWLDSLDEEGRAQAVDLRDRLALLGANAPEERARSEINDNIPELARFLILRRTWEYAINSLRRPGHIDNIPAARRLLDAGADREDLITLARRAACDAAFAVLYEIDVPHFDLDDEALPDWGLYESSGDDLPGRHIDDLHAELLMTDPSGQEAGDLLF